MQSALNIGPIGWSWVTGCFTLAFAVLWWSAFTSLTGMMTGFYPLRRLDSSSEWAKRARNASVVVAHGFPVAERGSAFGTFLMGSQLGGALAPLLVVPIQVHYGGAPRSMYSACWVWCGAWSGTHGFAIPRHRRRE